MPCTYRSAKFIRVLLAEDPGRSRGALAATLGMEPDLLVVAQVRDGDPVVDAVLTHRPDVAVLDAELPGTSGPEVAADLRDQVPDCRVLILTTSGGPELLRRAAAAGAAGLLVKDGPAHELTAAIRRVLTGETAIDPALAAAAGRVAARGVTPDAGPDRAAPTPALSPSPAPTSAPPAAPGEREAGSRARP
ncbi:response regulator [Streptomyces sp. NPDC005925]|uniref:response regulator n=1 Tax=Streptomyces sp. NPDC005925 TaxID=3157172 RepID=UPI0033C3A273